MLQRLHIALDSTNHIHCCNKAIYWYLNPVLSRIKLLEAEVPVHLAQATIAGGGVIPHIHKTLINKAGKEKGLPPM